MTVPAPSLPEPSERRLTPTGAPVGILGLLAVLVALAVSLLATPSASAAPLVRARSAVAPIAAPITQRVGPHEPKLPGESRIRAPAYDQTVVASGVGAEAEPTVVNLGGEGKVPGAINQQPPNALSPAWGASRTEVAGKSLGELQATGDPYVVAENTALPFRSGSVDQVITNSVEL